MVGVGADAELCFDFIYGVDEHVAVDRGNIFVEPHGTGEDVGSRRNNAVVARPSVVAKFDLRPPCEHCIVVLENLNEDGVEGGSAGTAAIASGVERAMVFAEPEKLTEFDAKKEVVIGFIKMNHAESVEFRVSWFFFDHRVDNILPSFETVAMLSSIL